MKLASEIKRRFANVWKALDGAATTTDRAVWQLPQLSTPGREITEQDRLTVAKQTWYFFNNVGMVKGAVNDLKRYAIGDGLRPIPLTENELWNDAALEFFANWSRVASVDGRTTWGEIEGGFSVDADTKGERFLLLTTQGEGNTYPAVQVIESQAVGTPDDPDKYDAGFTDGVRTNASGRSVAYQLKATGKKLPATAVIHYCENMRPGQLRGIPTLSHAVTQLFDSKDIKKHELMAGKINAAVAAVLNVAPTQGGNFLGTGASTASVETSIQQFENVSGTTVMRLPVGSAFTTHSSDRPNANFIPFLDYIIRDVATGMGLPPEFVWDSAKLGGATCRLAIAKASHRAKERRHLIEDKVSRRVWIHVIGMAIDGGFLPPQRDWWKVAFRGPSTPTADAGREAAQDREDFKIGATTMEELYGERGEDWKVALRQKAREIRFAKDAAEAQDIDFEELMQLYPNPQPEQPEPLKT